MKIAMKLLKILSIKLLLISLIILSYQVLLFFLLKHYYFKSLSFQEFYLIELGAFFNELFLFYYKIDFSIYAIAGLVFSIIGSFLVLMHTSTNKSLYGDAKFANLALIKKMNLLAPTGIILGKFGSRFIRTNQALATLVFAPPGTGKTASIALPNLLLSTNSFLTLDVKGELYDLTAGVRKKDGSKVFLFDPTSENSSKFNPLDEKLLANYSWDEKIQLLNQISHLIYINDKNDYWIEQGRQTFVSLGLYLLHTQNSTSIPQIRAFALSDMQEALKEFYAADESLDDDMKMTKELDLNAEDNLFKVWLKEVSSDKTLPLRVQEGLRALSQKPQNEFGSVVSSFLSPLEVFSQEQISKNLSQNDFDISSFRSAKSDCYIRVNEADMDVLKPIIRVFLDFNIKKLLSTLPSKKDKTITLLLDEFPRFGKLDFIIELPALSRAYKIAPIFICQSFSQIKETYKEKSSTIQSTTAYKVVFPQSDFETAKLFSDLVGNYTRKKISKSGKNFEGKSASVSYEGVKLITEQDILSLDPNTCFVLAINYYKNPIKATPYMYFKDKALLEKINKAKEVK